MGRRYTNPIAGPRNGASTKPLVLRALQRTLNISAVVPAPTASAGLPKNPAKNRHTIRLARLLENPAPRVNNMNKGGVVRYTICRPNISLIGAERIGPNARPRTYTVRGTRAVVRVV